MKPAALQRYCLAKPGAWLDQPWEHQPVVKVGPKIFAFLGGLQTLAQQTAGGHSKPWRTVGVKCGRDRDEADEWCDRFPDDAQPLAYIGRYGWNRLTVGRGIPDDEIRAAVDSSYDEVVSRLPKADRPTGAGLSAPEFSAPEFSAPEFSAPEFSAPEPGRRREP